MKKTLLQETYISLTDVYTDKQGLSKQLWNEVESQHSHPSRYYHTLQHLSDLHHKLSEIKDQIQNWDTTLFTLFYHDIIYDAAKTNNEEKSALFAEERMRKLHVPEVMIEACKKQIVATKTHQVSDDSDTNFFTDADLSILGSDMQAYAKYCENIRKEYAIFPNIMYNRGRKKVVENFLAMDRIFKTKIFFDKYEEQARINLAREVSNY